MSAGPAVHEQIAQVAHEALRTWRAVSGGEPLPAWEESPVHRQLALDAVHCALAGKPVEVVHGLRAAVGAAKPWPEAPEAERKESALVHAITTSLGCGQERWDVKTGTDAAAADVVMTAKPTTIAEMIAFPAPPPDPPARVAGEPEHQVYTLEATVSAIKIEADSDYHLALADDQGNTMIAEAACPGCAAGSPWLSQIQAVRAAIDAQVKNITDQYQDLGVKVTLTGVGFFDRIHGQRGVAGNGIELHPLLDIQFQPSGGGQP